MPAYKDEKTGTWFVKFYVKDWTGANKQVKKRGFADRVGHESIDMDEVFEDYQAIYDKTVEMQGDKEVGRKESGRGRVR